MPGRPGRNTKDSSPGYFVTFVLFQDCTLVCSAGWGGESVGRKCSYNLMERTASLKRVNFEQFSDEDVN